jgi:hypothetical protein
MDVLFMALPAELRSCDHAAVESAAISSADASGMCSSVMMRSPSVVWGIIVLGMPNDVPAAASAAAAADQARADVRRRPPNCCAMRRQ